MRPDITRSAGHQNSYIAHDPIVVGRRAVLARAGMAGVLNRFGETAP
jgi:hypothetical protein